MGCLVVYSFLNWRFYLLKPSNQIPEIIMLIFAPVVVAILLLIFVIFTWVEVRLQAFENKDRIW